MENALRWIQTACLVVVAVAAVPLASNHFAQQADRRHNQAEGARMAALGRAAMAAEDPQLAVEAFSQATAADAKNAEWREALLRATVDMTIADAGVINSGNALRLQSALARALTEGRGDEARNLVAFARVLQFRGQQEQALDRFKEAVAKDGKLAVASLLLGDAYLKAGKLDEAASTLAQSIALEDTPLAQFALGQVRIQQKRWDDAVPHLQKAEKALPNANVSFALGKAQWRRKKWKEAAAHLERALARDSKLVAAHAMLGDCWAEQQRPLLAMGAFRLAYERARDVDAYTKLARAQSQLKMWKEAIQTWTELRALNPDLPEPHCQLATAAEGIEDYSIAASAYRKCITVAGPKEQYATMVQQANLRVKAIEEAYAKANEGAKKKKKR